MDMTQIGYSLVDQKGYEVEFWGDVIGLCASQPEPLVLPNGDRVHGASLNEVYQEWMLVLRMCVNEPPGPLYKEIGRTIEFNTAALQTIVTIVYEETPTGKPVPPEVKMSTTTKVILDHEERIRQLEALLLVKPKTPTEDLKVLEDSVAAAVADVGYVM